MLFLTMLLVSGFALGSTASHFLGFLISLELLTLVGLVFVMATCSAGLLGFSGFVIYLVVAAGMAALGLSFLVVTSRAHGSDQVSVVAVES